MTVRLYAILARDANRAVVFRRGPSKRVLLIGWNTANDTFEEGQWLKGRIYERRCDLSPDGELLIYFAASYRKPYFSWSAVSRPPFLTALALWPKSETGQIGPIRATCCSPRVAGCTVFGARRRTCHASAKQRCSPISPIALSGNGRRQRKPRVGAHENRPNLCQSFY